MLREGAKDYSGVVQCRGLSMSQGRAKNYSGVVQCRGLSILRKGQGLQWCGAV